MKQIFQFYKTSTSDIPDGPKQHNWIDITQEEKKFVLCFKTPQEKYLLMDSIIDFHIHNKEHTRTTRANAYSNVLSSLESLVLKMKNPSKGIPLKAKTVGKTVYKDSFSGTDAVKWMKGNIKGISDENSEDLGKFFVEELKLWVLLGGFSKFQNADYIIINWIGLQFMKD